MFIAIEGCDGSGKGVQVEKLKAWLNEKKFRVEFFHDPGCTKLGDSIRELALESKDAPISRLAETALFMASRAQLVVEKIIPALKKNKTVLVDRYLLSTVVYQGYAYGVEPDDIEAIWTIGTYMAKGVMPDVTFVLDCPAELAEKRLNRPKDRIEQRSLEYRERVVDGYRRAVRRWGEFAPGRVYLINASQTPEKVFSDITNIIMASGLIEPKAPGLDEYLKSDDSRVDETSETNPS